MMKIGLGASLIALSTLSGTLAQTTYAADNRVSVLNSGYVQPIKGRGFLPGAQDDGARKVASTITLVQGRGIILIADPGMAAPGVWNTVLARLQAKGVQPADVTHVFISHHHPDHVTQIGLFPNATLVDFWATYKDDVWTDHPDNYELAPGIKVIRTPGHTDEDATLLVETREGTYALTHLWWRPGYEPKEDPLAEDVHGIVHSREFVLKEADWIVPGHGSLFRNSLKQIEKVNDTDRTIVLDAVEIAGDAWIKAFNTGNAVAAANAYEPDAVMTALPYGIFTGRKNIQVFWQNLISQGFAKVRYVEPIIEVINANTVVISSKWKMNKAYGVITKELWVLQDDGTAKLRIDNFKVLSDQ